MENMNSYTVKIFIIPLSVFCISIYGMDNKQKDCVMQRKAAQYMVSKLCFRDNEKILCVGPDYGKMKKKHPYIRIVDHVDVFEIPMRLLHYDKVLLFFSWKVMKNPQQIFINSANILKSEGRFCGIFPYYKSLYFDVYYQTLINNQWQNHYNKKADVRLYSR